MVNDIKANEMTLAYFDYIDQVNLTITALAEGSASEAKVIEAMSVDEYYTFRLSKNNYIQQINDSIDKASS